MSRRARSVDGVPAAAVVAAARALKGTPFRHQGRTARGLDCVGLCVVALAAAGLGVHGRADYVRQPDLALMTRELDGQLIRLARGTALSPGLIALFRDPAWLHCGILTGEGMIHARGPEGVGPGVVEHLVDEQSWRPRLMGLWRHPGMAWPD